MAKRGGGWVSISRKMFEEDSHFFGDAHLTALWIYIIANANWRDGELRLKRQQVYVKRGQFVTSQGQLAAAIGSSRTAVRNALSYLETSQRINQRKDGFGTIITVLKYDEYQTAAREDDQRNDQREDIKRPARDPRETRDPSTSEQVNKGTRKPDNNFFRENFDLLADVTVTDAVEAMHAHNDDEPAARAHIGEEGWDLLMRQFSTYGRLLSVYAQAFRTGYVPKWKKDTVLSMIARHEREETKLRLVHSAPSDEAPPLPEEPTYDIDEGTIFDLPAMEQM